jgi:RNA polymerase sigma factor (sigma-70 family)
MKNSKLIKELYEKYHTYLICIAKRTVPEVDAEDIVQNVFEYLIKSQYWLIQCVLTSDNPEKLRHILRAFLRNACNKHYRHSKVKNKIFCDLPDYELLSITTDTEQEYHDKDLIENIVNISAKSDKRGTDILMKYYLEGYSTDELAKQTGLSVSAIENYIWRSLKGLTKIIKK